MKDILLQAAAKAVNSDPDFKIDVTLVVGGFLITGSISDVKTYFEHNPLTKMMYEHANTSSCDSKEAGTNESGAESTNDLPQYIHLKGAQYFTATGNPIPGNENVFVRLDLDSVHGFSFGRLKSGN